MATKKHYIKKSFESTGKSSDTSANIYESMLVSEAWHTLTPSQQRLYICCKAQYYAEKQKPATEENPNGSILYFTMNRYKWSTKYQLYKDNNRAAFYRDMEALIEKGFVRCVESGRNTRTKSIYAFSDKWHQFGTEAFAVFPNEMTSSMLKKLCEKEA